MKLLQATLAAVLAVSSLGIGSAALAQGKGHEQARGNHERGHVEHDRTDPRHHADRDRRNDRDHASRGRNVHRGYNDNRGRHLGWRNNPRHRVCKTVWRNNHRQRVCRWVRR